jgi:hypothetical protein
VPLSLCVEVSATDELSVAEAVSDEVSVSASVADVVSDTDEVADVVSTTTVVDVPVELSEIIPDEVADVVSTTTVVDVPDELSSPEEVALSKIPDEEVSCPVPEETVLSLPPAVLFSVDVSAAFNTGDSSLEQDEIINRKTADNSRLKPGLTPETAENKIDLTFLILSPPLFKYLLYIVLPVEILFLCYY